MLATEGVVRDWLKALGAVVAATLNAREADAKLAAYVPLLRMQFGDEAFTAETLATVARRCKFFPTFAEICEHLSEHLRARRPLVVALAPPVERVAEPPDEAALAHVAGLVGALKAELLDAGAGRESARPDAARSIRTAVLSDEMLLAIHEAAAAKGSQPSAIRAGMLRAKIGRPQMERNRAYVDAANAAQREEVGA